MINDLFLVWYVGKRDNYFPSFMIDDECLMTIAPSRCYHMLMIISHFQVLLIAFILAIGTHQVSLIALL